MKRAKPSHCRDCEAAITQSKYSLRLHCDGCRAERGKLLSRAWYLENRKDDPDWAEKNKARAKLWRKNQKALVGTGRPTVCAALGEVFSH